MNKSLVVGSTGLVGSHVLEQLSERGERPIAVLRSVSDALPKDIQVHQIDFDELLTSGELPLCDHLYLCLGTTIKTAGSKEAFRRVDFDYCVGIAKLAINAGTSVVSLVSSVGADASSSNFYLRTKGEVEEALRALGFSTLNIYRPGLLLGKRLEKRVGEGLGKIIFKLIDPFLLGAFSKYRSVKAETLARAMIEKSTIAKGINWFHFRQFKS